MKIPLELSPKNVPLFLDYFDSSLSEAGFTQSHGSYLQNGKYRVRVCRTTSSPGDGLGPVELAITRNIDGTLDPIEVFPPGPSDERLLGEVRSLVDEALVRALNGATEKFFHRHRLAYFGPRLDGEYWISGWRLAPTIPDDHGDFTSERLVDLDMNVSAIDRHHSIALGRLQGDRIASLLSLFVGVGFYRIPSEKRWVLHNDGRPERLQLGYTSGRTIPSEMPGKGSECRLGGYRPVDRLTVREMLHTDNILRCPSDVRELFRAVRSLSASDFEAYHGAAALYHLAVTAGPILQYRAGLQGRRGRRPPRKQPPQPVRIR